VVSKLSWRVCHDVRQWWNDKGKKEGKEEKNQGEMARTLIYLPSSTHLPFVPSRPISFPSSLSPSPGRVRAQYAERGGSSSSSQGQGAPAVSAFVALNPRDQAYGKEGVFIRSACYKVRSSPSLPSFLPSFLPLSLPLAGSVCCGGSQF